MSCIVSGVGRLGKDSVLRPMPDNSTVLSFSLAMENGFGDKKQTLWFDCSGFGKRFAGVVDHLKKGAKVFVTGEQGEHVHEGKPYKTLRLSSLDLVATKPAE